MLLLRLASIDGPVTEPAPAIVACYRVRARGALLIARADRRGASLRTKWGCARRRSGPSRCARKADVAFRTVFGTFRDGLTAQRTGDGAHDLRYDSYVSKMQNAVTQRLIPESRLAGQFSSRLCNFLLLRNEICFAHMEGLRLGRDVDSRLRLDVAEAACCRCGRSRLLSRGCFRSSLCGGAFPRWFLGHRAFGRLRFPLGVLLRSCADLRKQLLRGVGGVTRLACRLVGFLKGLLRLLQCLSSLTRAGFRGRRQLFLGIAITCGGLQPSSCLSNARTNICHRSSSIDSGERVSISQRQSMTGACNG